jgi:PGDYG protein
MVRAHPTGAAEPGQAEQPGCGAAECGVSSRSSRLFFSSAQRGYSSFVNTDPHRVFARKLVREVQVRFTPVACTVQTSEGLVHARPGDAILSGGVGEHWRVSRARFAEKYRPVPPTVDGEAGRYISLPNRVIAVPMKESFEVLLADGVSRLSGRAGDWLVDYGDGSLGIVSQAIFASTYEVIN